MAEKPIGEVMAFFKDAIRHLCIEEGSTEERLKGAYKNHLLRTLDSLPQNLSQEAREKIREIEELFSKGNSTGAWGDIHYLVSSLLEAYGMLFREVEPMPG